MRTPPQRIHDGDPWQKAGPLWVPRIGLPNPTFISQILKPASGGGGGGGCTTARDTINGTTTGSGNTQGYRYAAQRFTAGASVTICRAVLRLARDAGVTGTLTVRLYSHNATGNGTPNTSLGSGTLSIGGLGTTEGDGEITGLSVALTSGTIYWVVIDDPTNGGNFSGGTIWYWEAASAVANNMVYSSDGTTWTELNNNTRFKFILYST